MLLAFGGLVYLIFPGLSAPPIFYSMLMMLAGIAWGFYTLRGAGSENPLADTTGNFVRAVPNDCVGDVSVFGKYSTFDQWNNLCRFVRRNRFGHRLFALVFGHQTSFGNQNRDFANLCSIICGTWRSDFFSRNFIVPTDFGECVDFGRNCACNSGKEKMIFLTQRRKDL